MVQTDDMVALDKYCGAAGFLNSLGANLGDYLEGLAASFPNQQSLDTSGLYAFIEVRLLLLCLQASMACSVCSA